LDLHLQKPRTLTTHLQGHDGYWYKLQLLERPERKHKCRVQSNSHHMPGTDGNLPVSARLIAPTKLCMRSNQPDLVSQQVPVGIHQNSTFIYMKLLPQHYNILYVQRPTRDGPTRANKSALSGSGLSWRGEIAAWDRASHGEHLAGPSAALLPDVRRGIGQQFLRGPP